MQLSEAIRLGAMLKPQGFAWMHNKGRTCALGAAMDACGVLPAEQDEPTNFDGLIERWPLLNVVVTSPCKMAVIDGNVSNVIIGLNDYAEWPRERIADWIETIEAQIDPPALMVESPVTVDAVDPHVARQE